MKWEQNPDIELNTYEILEMINVASQTSEEKNERFRKWY